MINLSLVECNGCHRYIGDFLNDDFHGEGVYIWPNGKKYKGSFYKGVSHGHGNNII